MAPKGKPAIVCSVCGNMLNPKIQKVYQYVTGWAVVGKSWDALKAIVRRRNEARYLCNGCFLGGDPDTTQGEQQKLFG